MVTMQDRAISLNAVLEIFKELQGHIDEQVVLLFLYRVYKLPPVTPCEDAISREQLIERLEDFNKWCKDGRLQGSKFAVDVVKDMPPVTPQPNEDVMYEEYMRGFNKGKVSIPTGHWIEGKYKDTCDKCRCTYPKNIGFKNYCPNCGAKMVEPQEISDRNLKMWEDIYAEEKRREGSE